MLTGFVTTSISPSVSFAQENQFRLVMPDRVWSAINEEGIDPNLLQFEPVDRQICNRDTQQYRLIMLRDDHSRKIVEANVSRSEAAEFMKDLNYGAGTLYTRDGQNIISIFSVHNGQVFAAKPESQNGNIVIPELRRILNRCMA